MSDNRIKYYLEFQEPDGLVGVIMTLHINPDGSLGIYRHESEIEEIGKRRGRLDHFINMLMTINSRFLNNMKTEKDAHKSITTILQATCKRWGLSYSAKVDGQFVETFKNGKLETVIREPVEHIKVEATMENTISCEKSDNDERNYTVVISLEYDHMISTLSVKGDKHQYREGILTIWRDGKTVAFFPDFKYFLVN